MKQQRYAGQVVLITGGARGIGAQMCRRFAEEGAQVIADYAPSERSREAFPPLKAEIEAAGGKIEGIECDVSDRQAVAAMVDQIVSRFGRIDVLVSNAVVGIRRTYDQIDENDLDRMFHVYVGGALWCSQACLPHMIAQKSGSVVFISSNASVNGGAGSCLYPACKGALESMMRGLVNETAMHNVRINIVRPGIVNTALQRNRYTPEQWENYMNALPMKRAASPDEVAEAVLFISDRERAGYINGTILDVDGARTHNLRPKY